MSTKKKKTDSLIIKLIDGKRHQHRVALVTDEGEWNQHEPNTGMARMFVVMLLIHVVLIGGIIVYDFIGEEETPAQSVTQAARALSSTSGLPIASEEVISAQAQATSDSNLDDNYEVYEMRSGDSLPSLAQRFGTTEQVLTELNLLDKGITIGAGTRLRIPKQAVTAAVPVDPTTLAPIAQSDEAPKAIPFTLNSPPPTESTAVNLADAPASIAAAATPMSLLAPNESPPATGDSLLAAAQAPATTPAPPENTELIGAVPNPQAAAALALAVEENEKAIAAADEAARIAAAPKPVEEPKKVVAPPAPKPLAKPNPVAPPSQMIKRIADTPPATKSAAKKPTTQSAPPKPATKSAASRSHVLAAGETLYRLSTKYGVSVDALIKANGIKNPNSMREGMKLVIPAK